jgi:DMSO/TMAO reductase YedYZ molybdopterin-dependent catalytic subunit
MAEQTRYPGSLIGALIGAFLTLLSITVFFLGSQVAGLPFVPFDVFDWMARVLPGSLVRTGIETMVSGIRAVGIGGISEAAKVVEQVMALCLILAVGTGVGAALFAVLSRRRKGLPDSLMSGALLGVTGGVGLLLVSLAVNQTATAGPVAGALWILAVSVAWGAALGWSHAQLTVEEETGSDATPPVASVAAVDRRQFIVRMGGAVAVITVTGGSVGAWVGATRRRPPPGSGGTPWSATHPLPNADASVQPVRGTRPELTPVEDHYRIDINTRPPAVDEVYWRLRIGGLVDQPSEWTLAELRDGYEPMHQFVTLACISNPIGGSLVSTQRWTGVPLRLLLEEAGPGATATHLRIRGADDFFEVASLEEVMADERIMLTYAWDGLPLPPGHGFPLRIYIPDRYGMKQPKWIESIELIDQDEEGYWVRRGWDREARMKATSVIDTIGVDMMISAADETTLVPVGGIARAGSRGIAKVEVRVDNGPWTEAEIRDPLSSTTWVLWKFEWPFQAGDHTFAVRCIEGDGTPQIEARSPVSPSGATGLHHEEVML